MNTEETRLMVVHIEDCVEKIRKRINLNTVLFLITTIGVGLLAVTSNALSNRIERNSWIAQESLKTGLEANAKLDAAERAYTDYIQTTLGAILDKLQWDNPKLSVPKAPKVRPMGLPPPDPTDLERSPYERPPTPTPTAKPTPPPRESRSRSYRKSQTRKVGPTPKPWYQFFKTTR